jgi:hypothetical protein
MGDIAFDADAETLTTTAAAGGSATTFHPARARAPARSLARIFGSNRDHP